MASLLERMNIAPDGPARTKRGGKGDRASPYTRQPSKGNSDGRWEHDMAPLEARIGNVGSKNAPKINSAAAATALAQATGQGRSGSAIQIKGASSVSQNVVEVRGLVPGTTAEDVKAIFSQIGAVTQAKSLGGRNDPPVVRITYKDAKDATTARDRFDGQTADGRKLSVTVVGILGTDLSARIERAPVVVGGSVDSFLQDASGGSKLRSDAILASDARAAVITTPAGQNPADYNTQSRGGRGRGGRRRGGPGRGRGGARGGKKAEGGMDVD